MYANRPRIKVPLAPIDTILEASTIALLIALWIYVIISYNSLPEIVPTHVDIKGNVDGTGHKNTIWFLLGITTIITIGLHVLTKFPHIHNYMVKITEENAEHNYQISNRLLRFVNILTLLLLAYVCYSSIQKAFGNDFFLESALMYIIIAYSVVMPIVLIVFMLKNQKDPKSK
ncbi:DUF1648 domain-containing protein [Kordia sp.]|uniref:DUF1648 domain-containing protein n=1 Tax=Kordia sp. TaxID=1965332 RepID=UPI0025BA4389|nr:DUF1648 domain-containing protein [Kordia sp.]MCH2195416.1 DUF1648 domain-containing protein [Kordia sp.]